MAIVFIFIDGVGCGPDSVNNPFSFTENLVIFNNCSIQARKSALPKDGTITFIDANLDTPGIPQSATGQTSIYTGCNASKEIGYHRSGFPNQKLRDLIEKKSVFTRLKMAGKKPVFVNAYRPIFFEHGPENLLRYLSVTSIQNWKAGCRFYSLEDLKNHRSIYHDFTNVELIHKGFEVPLFSPVDAATILASFMESHDFILYEYFKTDKVGHSRNHTEASTLIVQLEALLLSLLKLIDLRSHTVVVTSDHGNIEDLSIKSHTRNPVPFIVWGYKKKFLTKDINSITEIRNLILNYFNVNV